jgi:hypothetical protein
MMSAEDNGKWTWQANYNGYSIKTTVMFNIRGKEYLKKQQQTNL